MTITLNGTTGITTDGGYTGDGISFADGTPSNTLVTDTSGNVGIGGTPVSLASTKTLTVTDATEARIQLQNTASGSTSADGVSLAINGTDFYVNNRENGNIITYVNGAERMRIDSSGYVLVGTTTNNRLATTNTQGLRLTGASGDFLIQACSTQTPVELGLKGTTGNIVNFYKDGTNTGNITVTNTTTSYVTSSDYRLKENVQPMTGALAKVSALKPVTYTWKADGSEGQGFIAHELQEIIPDCVTGEKDAVNEDGSIKAQAIDTSFLVATLTAAIQEQQAIISDLKARIETLENK